jgi:2-methylcitrate dehydratase PrpD
MSTTEQGYTRKIGEYIASLQYSDLPPSVVKQTKKVVLDALGSQVACSMLENGKTIIKYGESVGGKGESSIIGSSYKTSAANAALVNGTLGHGDEIDDVLYEAGHAAAGVIPAALACGERQKANGKEMITAVIAGYDIAARLSNAGISVPALRLGYSDGFATVFWSVSAASNILKLDVNKTIIALGLAGCQSGGYYDFSESRHMAKSLMFGLGARNGVTAALLAKIGFDGPHLVFDGDNTILKYQAGEQHNSEELIRDLGVKYSIMDTSLKLYSVGHPIHAPAHGLIKMMESENLSPDNIRSITVYMARRESEVINDRKMPEINLQYCLSVAAFDHRLTWDQFAPERLNDQKIADLKNRVKIVHDPYMDNLKEVNGSHSAKVEIETMDGNKFSSLEEYPPGDAKRPLSQQEVEQKVIYYASKVIGKDRAKSLIEMVNNLENVSDLNELGDKLRIDNNRPVK